MGKLDDRVAIVTGGSRGIGYSIADELIREGARVMITGRNADSLASAAAVLGPAAATFVGEAGDRASARECIAEVMRRFGRIDILVNNAARDIQSGPTMAMPLDDFTSTYEVNVFAPLHWTQLAWQAHMEKNGGVVLNVASLGAISLQPNMGAYLSSKAALLHLTRILAAELGPRVRVNALAPGLIKTEMSSSAWLNNEERFAGNLPLERLGEAEDVARAALFLITDDSSWVTGETLVIDGGALIQWGKPRKR